tara:strand:+ start:9231 stop:10970 length:1740 start_codon:yes stop_codon:yes gene_type:complete
MGIFKKTLFFLNKKHKLQAVKLFFLMMLGMLLEVAGVGLIIPILGIITNKEIISSNIYLSEFFKIINSFEGLSPILVVMIVFGCFFIFKAIFMIFLSWRQSSFIFLLQADLSKSLFNGYLRLPYTFHLQRNSSELHRNIDETADIAAAVSAQAIFISELLVLTGIIILLLVIEPIGTLIVIFFFMTTSFLLYFLTKNILHKFGSKRHIDESHRLRHLKHGLTGIKVIKASGYEDYFVKKFSFYVYSIANINKKQTVVRGLPRILLETLTVVSLACLVSVLTLQNQSTSEIITLIAVFGAAAFRLIPSFNKLIGSAQTLKYVSPVLTTLFNEFKSLNLISYNKEIVNTNLDVNPINFSTSSSIDLNNISLTYPGTDTQVLNKLSLVINYADTIGISGESGSGKSTLIDVIMGLISINLGTIKVDGNNINDNLRGWQKNIGYVPQEIFLIDDTIASNIAFGVEVDLVDDEALKSSIKMSSIGDFIESLPLGVKTIVGENGARLSGGQRQRIGIARALYHRPSLLIFDEATSALDIETEKRIMDTIYAISNERTIIIITHRPNTLKHCNKIFMMENGSLKAK